MLDRAKHTRTLPNDQAPKPPLLHPNIRPNDLEPPDGGGDLLNPVKAERLTPTNLLALKILVPEPAFGNAGVRGWVATLSWL